jgi:hypothetical protein
VQSTKYVNFYLENVLTIFNKIGDEHVKFEVLKAFSDMCLHYNGASADPVNSLRNLDILYDIMIVIFVFDLCCLLFSFLKIKHA